MKEIQLNGNAEWGGLLHNTIGFIRYMVAVLAFLQEVRAGV